MKNKATRRRVAIAAGVVVAVLSTTPAVAQIIDNETPSDTGADAVATPSESKNEVTSGNPSAETTGPGSASTSPNE